ncbi:MAG: AgmX/PglI C-terminal domain-containing protein [Candidatus Sabulitectum sp.]|nr:AgmX/PglI C-terminal domain-containing protein [Candidatus Sabulitectum sp.]
MADARKKILAIAAMREGKVITKLLPGEREITLGSGYNNSISVEAPGIPESIVLIKTGEEKETWDLRLSDAMDAQITSLNGSKLKFSDLKGLGIFNTDDDGNYVLKVNYGDQGVVTAGHFVIHFGFIDPPKVVEKKVQPKKKAPPGKQKQTPSPPDKRMLKLSIEDPDGRRDIFPNAGIMTIGQADYNTICVKVGKLPRIHTLLEPEQDNKYILRLIPEIKGGVEVKGSVIPFATLIERNLLKQEKPGDPYIWVFDRSVSGVFTVGNTEVFFSFAEPPAEILKPKPKPVVSKPKLKPSVYNWKIFAARPHEVTAFHAIRREDSRFNMLLGIGLAAALLMGAVTDRLILVVKESKTQMLRSAPSARVVQLAETPPSASGMGEEIVSDMPVAEMATSGGVAGDSDAPVAAGAAEGADAASDVLSSIGFAAYGTGAAGGGAGFIGDLQSAASSGTGLSSGQSGQDLIAGAGGGGSGGIGGLAGGGGGVAATAGTVSASDMQAAHQAAQVTFSASASGEAIDLGYRNMSDIRRKINIIKMRVQTAYESLLRSNPGASGTITINFSITPGGSVTGVSVSCPGPLASLQGTVTSAVSSLNFGPAPEQTGNLPVTVPFSLVPPQ